MTLPYASAVLVLLGTGWLSGRLLARGYTSRVARGGLSAACLTVSGLSMIAFTVLPTGALQFGLVVLAFSTSGVSFAVGFQAVSDFLPHRHRAAFFGALVAVYSIAGIATPYVFGLVLEAAPSIAEGYATAFAVLGASLVVMAAVGAALTDPEKSREILLRAGEARAHTATGGPA